MNTPVSLVVLRPTRGLEFTESALSVELALAEASNWDRIEVVRPILRTWGQPIPDSFNHLVRTFLVEDTEYAWIVEEDVVVPLDAIEQMLELRADVAAINYNLKVGGPGRDSEVHTAGGDLHTLGTGCMLVRRAVFETLPDPWFRTDLAPGMRHPGSSTPNPFLDLIPNSFEYGGHDGFFTLSAIRAGFRVASVPGVRCEHLMVNSLGKQGVNDGCHSIVRVQ